MKVKKFNTYKSFLIALISSVIIVLSSSNIQAQSIIDIVKEKQKEAPTKFIFFADSLLFYNTTLSNEEIAQIKYHQIYAYQRNSNYEKSLDLLDEIFPTLKKDSRLFVKALVLKSYALCYLRKYTEATSDALHALSISKQNGFDDLIISANGVLSFVHYSNGDYISSLSFLNNSVEFLKKDKDSMALSSTYNNIAIIYKNMTDYEKAISYNTKSLNLSIASHDPVGVGKSYSNLGRIYEEQVNIEKALDFYNKAIEHNTKNNLSNSIPYRNIADIYIKRKEFDKADTVLLNALKIENRNKNYSEIKKIYSTLLKNAILNQAFIKALEYMTNLQEINVINNKKTNEEKSKMLENQYKLFQSKSEVNQLIRISNKNKIIFGISFGSLILLFLVWYQINKNKQLVNQREKLNLEQIVLRSQMNPHFIFNALSAIQNSLLDHEPLKSATYLSRFAKLIRQNFDFINQSTISLEDEINALENYMDTQKMRFKDKFDYEIIVDQDINITLLEVPPLLIQPFIENSIEHGFKNKKDKGLIIIKIYRNENKICYEIIDNGSGFKASNQSKREHALDIFKKRLKLLGNNDEKSFIISSSPEGTKIKFSLIQ